MQLSFLGKSYEAPTPAIEATTTQDMGQFLGRSYSKKTYTVAQRRQPAEALTYRGQRYLR